MSNSKIYIEFTKAREGGLSKAKTDSASKYPVPDGSGYHTNKGITWKAFKEILPKYQIKPTPKLFYEMPDNIFDVIFQHYWDTAGANLIDSQAIANLVFQALWGGGHTFLVRDIQLFLRERGFNISANGRMEINTAKAVNEYSIQNEKILHQYTFDSRLKYLRSLKAYVANGKGWEARMKKLYDFNVQLMAHL